MPRVKREDTELVGLLASDGDRSRSGQQGSTSAGISLNANSSRYPGVVNELDTDDIYDEEQLEGGTRGLHGAQEAQGQQRAHAARDSMRSAWRAARGQWSRIAHAGLHGPRAAMACLALGGFCASLILLLVISAALGASEGGGSGGGAGGARVLRKGEPTVLPMCSRSAPRTYCGTYCAYRTCTAVRVLQALHPAAHRHQHAVLHTHRTHATLPHRGHEPHRIHVLHCSSPTPPCT